MSLLKHLPVSSSGSSKPTENPSSSTVLDLHLGDRLLTENNACLTGQANDESIQSTYTLKAESISSGDASHLEPTAQSTNKPADSKLRSLSFKRLPSEVQVNCRHVLRPLFENSLLNLLLRNDQIGAANPQSLILSIWYLVSRYFGVSSRSHHSKLTLENLHIIQNEISGADELEFSPPSFYRPPVSTDSELECLSPEFVISTRADGTPPEMCPIHLFKTYLVHRPPHSHGLSSPLYLQPLTKRYKNCWFTGNSLGKNKIGAMFSSAVHSAGLPAARSMTLQRLCDILLVTAFSSAAGELGRRIIQLSSSLQKGYPVDPALKQGLQALTDQLMDECADPATSAYAHVKQMCSAYVNMRKKKGRNSSMSSLGVVDGEGSAENSLVCPDAQISFSSLSQSQSPSPVKLPSDSLCCGGAAALPSHTSVTPQLSQRPPLAVISKSFTQTSNSTLCRPLTFPGIEEMENLAPYASEQVLVNQLPSHTPHTKLPLKLIGKHQHPVGLATQLLWHSHAFDCRGPWMLSFSMWWLMQHYFGVGNRSHHALLKWAHVRLIPEVRDPITGLMGQALEYVGPTEFITVNSYALSIKNEDGVCVWRVYPSTGWTEAESTIASALRLAAEGSVRPRLRPLDTEPDVPYPERRQTGPDFVALYRLFAERRPASLLEANSPFYLEPIKPSEVVNRQTLNQPWFDTTSLDKARIAALLRNVLAKIVRPNLDAVSSTVMKTIHRSCAGAIQRTMDSIPANVSVAYREELSCYLNRLLGVPDESTAYLLAPDDGKQSGMSENGTHERSVLPIAGTIEDCTVTSSLANLNSVLASGLSQLQTALSVPTHDGLTQSAAGATSSLEHLAANPAPSVNALNLTDSQVPLGYPVHVIFLSTSNNIPILPQTPLAIPSQPTSFLNQDVTTNLFNVAHLLSSQLEALRRSISSQPDASSLVEPAESQVKLEELSSSVDESLVANDDDVHLVEPELVNEAEAGTHESRTNGEGTAISQPNEEAPSSTYQDPCESLVLPTMYNHSLLTSSPSASSTTASSRIVLPDVWPEPQPHELRSFVSLIRKPELIQSLLTHGLRGASRPWALNFCAWLVNTIAFTIDNRLDHAGLVWGNFHLGQMGGMEYLGFRDPRDSSVHFLAGLDPSVKAFPLGDATSMTFNENLLNTLTLDSLCPVTLFKALRDHRFEQCLKPDSKLYLQPRCDEVILTALSNATNDRVVWFTDRPWGKNRLGSLLTEACRKADISPVVLRRARISDDTAAGVSHTESDPVDGTVASVIGRSRKRKHSPCRVVAKVQVTTQSSPGTE